MFFGIYLCAVGLFLFLNLLIFSRLRPRIGLFTLLTLLLALLILMVFGALSAWAGLMRFGQPYNFSFPGDYLAYGPLGWVMVIILLLGVLSPFMVASWMNRRRNSRVHRI